MQAEYAKTRERARALMAERDAEVEALKARLRSAGIAAASSSFAASEDGAHASHSAPAATPEPLLLSLMSPQKALPEFLASLTSAAREPETQPNAGEETDAPEEVQEAAVGAVKAQVQAVAAKVDAILKQAEAQQPVEAGAVREVADAIEAAVRAAAAEEARLVEVSKALEDSERTEQLRDQTSALLKEEVNELRRNVKASEVDTVYLKNVLVAALEKGEFKASPEAFHMIERLLVFSPEEVERCIKGKGQAQLQRRVVDAAWRIQNAFNR
jgi:hypothetical protein